MDLMKTFSRSGRVSCSKAVVPVLRVLSLAASFARCGMLASSTNGTVGSQHKWDSLGPERSGVWKSFGELPEVPVMKSSPIDRPSLHLPSAL